MPLAEQRLTRTLLNYQPKTLSRQTKKTLPSSFQGGKKKIEACPFGDEKLRHNVFMLLCIARKATENSAFVMPTVATPDKAEADHTHWMGDNYLCDSPSTERKNVSLSHTHTHTHAACLVPTRKRSMNHVPIHLSFWYCSGVFDTTWNMQCCQQRVSTKPTEEYVDWG